MFSNNNTRRLLGTILIALMALILAACGTQPPSCTSSDMGKTIKSILLDDMVGFLKATEQTVSKDRLSFFEKYSNGLKIDFGATVETLYNKETKTRVCEGKFAVKTDAGEKWDITAQWKAQVTSDGKDTLVNLSSGAYRADISRELIKDMNTLLAKDKGLSDLWGGRMICAPIPDALEPDKETAGYSQYVVFKVDGTSLFALRKTLSGMTERYHGDIKLLTNSIPLQIDLLNENDRSVNTFHEVFTIEGNKISANRSIRLWHKRGLPIQECTHELTKGQSKPT